MTTADPLEPIRRALDTEDLDEAGRRDLLSQALIYADEVRHLYLAEKARADELQSALEKMEQAQEELKESLAMLRKTDEHRRHLLKGLVEAEERERKRIAGDIHDDSIQIMAAVSLRLHTIRQKTHDAESLELLSRLETTVVEAIQRLRTLLFNLRPPSLDRQGLRTAIEEYVEATTEPGGPAYHVDCNLRSEPPEEVRILLYRIIQEALTNVRKHAQASRVDISVREDAGGILVDVTDDGVGFAEASGTQRGHLGLASIRERAETAGGWSRVETTPGDGTSLQSWVPAHADRDGYSFPEGS